MLELLLFSLSMIRWAQTMLLLLTINVIIVVANNNRFGNRLMVSRHMTCKNLNRNKKNPHQFTRTFTICINFDFAGKNLVMKIVLASGALPLDDSVRACDFSTIRNSMCVWWRRQQQRCSDNPPKCHSVFSSFSFCKQQMTENSLYFV